ncbi:MAG: LysM peptidoglycan-binding domain-containing protein [Firmicutes bacterium]|jgi:LysM repeat protein|nr:LysM peptidoglycan-binding domain-containing protein [Bacillota bacterium]
MKRLGIPVAVLFAAAIAGWPGPAVRGCAAAHFGYRPLGPGARGEDVRTLQSCLGKLGYFEGEPTGYYGPKTAAAVRSFQVSRGGKGTGEVSKETLGVLMTIVAMLEWSEFGLEIGEGDTLEAVAKAYGVPARLIALLNGMEEGAELRPGDRVRIPVPEFTMHRVSEGECLASIASRFGVGWRALAGWNLIEAPYVIYPGQVLVIPVACEYDDP